MTKQLNTPLVSVILPVFNGDKFLTEAIQSITNQTHSNIELFCINDGSTDNSLNILKEFAKKDKRIIIVNNPKNLGMSASINKVIPKTKGEFIARMDADDISLPKRFEKQIKLLQSNSNLVAVGCQETIIDQNGRKIAVKNFPTQPEVCYQTLANFMPIQPPTLMIRGDILRQLRYDTKICPQDDINIFFKLLQHGQLSNVDQILFKYRQINSSLTHSRAKKVYFMALRNRIDAIANYNYRPSLTRIILAILETFLVSILPSKTIIDLFNFIRHQQDAILSFNFQPVQLIKE